MTEARPPDSDDTNRKDPLSRGMAAAFDSSAPSPQPSVIERIGQITGARPSVSLREVDAAGQTPMLKPLAPGDGVCRETGKYLVHGLLGQGGVGAVHKGHDTDLGRDVAMKFLHEQYKDQPAVLHRFVDEAQIGGQLQHPGIVPVYELGMADGRPFFTMKMVKGQTLAQKLSERSSPDRDRRTFLSIFEDVCQTMAYAHARGVVHRDLKPANIMIGSFGEVQVVDWGMGKVLERGGVADEKRAVEQHAQLSIIETARSRGDGSKSVIGSVMGTPAYMPPEQARGDVEAMNERSDVFALGAILCEILTGQPPYVGEQRELLAMAAMAKLDDAYARLRHCGAEEDLIELATKCLLAAPAARPQSAQAVAQAVHDHLAAAEARVHDARVEAAEANVRAAALKRTQKMGIALTAVVAAGLLASLWLWSAASDAATRERTAAQNEAEARELADAKAEEARANLANFNRLSHVVRLETAKAQEQTLYPAWPDKAQQMRSWLDTDAKALQAALPELRTTLSTLTNRARRQSAGTTSAGEADQFLHDTLLRVVADIEAFVGTEVRAVEQRLSWARQVEQLTITRHKQRWDRARLAILEADDVSASELYGALAIELQPQMGLVPIGMNPKTLLWEFYDLRSAWDGERDPLTLPIPAHREDGSIEVTADMGIVFVLLPGGTFTLGAQKTDPDGPNYDPAARADEQRHEVTLAPFFLARHELTKGQWKRMSGGAEPSWHELGKTVAPDPAAVGYAHPVEQVNWTKCDALMQQHGMVIPTEAQWEYGCRGGTQTPWWPGSNASDLAGCANVLDKTAKRSQPQWGQPTGDFDDGRVIIGPVGSYRPNDLGLYDVHGNVWEWCRDRYSDYGTEQPGDGLRTDVDTSLRTCRGGGFVNPAGNARSAGRFRVAPTFLDPSLGLRAARPISN